MSLVVALCTLSYIVCKLYLHLTLRVRQVDDEFATLKVTPYIPQHKPILKETTKSSGHSVMISYQTLTWYESVQCVENSSKHLNWSL